jgi:hypothetical protein
MSRYARHVLLSITADGMRTVSLEQPVPGAAAQLAFRLDIPMRYLLEIPMRYLTVLAVSAATILALAACSSTSTSTTSQGPPVSSSGPPTTSSQSTQDGAVTGTVTWPDGHPAAGASVYFYNHDPGFTASGWSDGEYQVQQLRTDGFYSLVGCPCGDLTAYLYIPSTPGADPANGGRDCWIIMRDANDTYSGIEASPGDVVNWQALNMLCSPNWYTSDQSTVQSQATVIDPSQNGGDYSTYAGTWQAAQLRTSGAGSSG